ncbi:MAG: hypothetical protein IJA35_07820, partial [Clostridia bacterium]|nr:hypothetical protein [Clostridia bacterium]
MDRTDKIRQNIFLIMILPETHLIVQCLFLFLIIYFNFLIHFFAVLPLPCKNRRFGDAINHEGQTLKIH